MLDKFLSVVAREKNENHKYYKNVYIFNVKNQLAWDV